ncbi:MAG TPA: Hsp20/alpha crystallin family protein [Desulfomonilia bacterium]|jgi:HSP20 family protein
MFTILNPFREFQDFDQDMGRIFSRGRQAYPPVNVYVTGDDVVVTSEVPGIEASQIDLTVAGDMLTLKAEKKPVDLKEGEKWHRNERAYGSFNRTVKLPYNVDSSKIEALYDKGILKLTLPRAESDKPRKINVRTTE